MRLAHLTHTVETNELLQDLAAYSLNHADLSVLDPTSKSISGRVPRTSRVYDDDEDKCLQLLYGARLNKF